MNNGHCNTAPNKSDIEVIAKITKIMLRAQFVYLNEFVGKRIYYESQNNNGVLVIFSHAINIGVMRVQKQNDEVQHVNDGPKQVELEAVEIPFVINELLQILGLEHLKFVGAGAKT